MSQTWDGHTPMATLQGDPRWIEFRDAQAAVAEGLSAPAGAHERYRQAQGPYVVLLAEHSAPHVRKPMMRALFEQGMSLGVILIGFKATDEETDYVTAHPPFREEAADEIERLRAMPYGLYLRTPHWRRVQAEALKRADKRCALCNRGTDLQVHHRTYERKGCESPADVIVLCDSCHTRHHGHMSAA